MGALKRDFKPRFVIDVKFVGNAVKWPLEHVPGEQPVTMDDQKWDREKQLADGIRRANAARGKCAVSRCVSVSAKIPKSPTEKSPPRRLS